MNEKRIHLFLLPCHVVALTVYLTSAPALSIELKVCTVQFLHLKTCGVRKGGKKTNKDGAGYEVITRFILFYLGVWMNLHPYFPHFLAELGEIRYRYVRNAEQLWLVRIGAVRTMPHLFGRNWISACTFRIYYPLSLNLWKQGRPYFYCDRKLNYIYACSVNMTFWMWRTPW